MIFWKVLIILLLATDTLIGFRFLLNVIGVLDTSKYGKGATALYAFLFLGLAAAGIYFLFFTPNIRAAIWLAIGPWVLMLLVMLVVMTTSRYP